MTKRMGGEDTVGRSVGREGIGDEQRQRDWVRLSSDAVMMAGRSRIVGTVAYSNRVEATKRRGIRLPVCSQWGTGTSSGGEKVKVLVMVVVVMVMVMVGMKMWDEVDYN